jgi:hypothetical protein
MELLEWQVDNFGLARAGDGWFRYRKRGGRASGDMNTSMGNKLLMTLMCKSFIDSHPVRIELCNNGDDCLLILEKKHLKHLDNLGEFFRDFGFKIVTELPVSEFEQIEFCQCRPMKGPRGWRMVRNPKSALLKDVTMVNLGHRVDECRVRMGQIGGCGLAVAEDIPVMGAFYSMCSRIGVSGKTSVSTEGIYGYYGQNDKLVSRGAKPDDYSRYSFFMATGIVPDAQVALEKWFDDGSWGPEDRQIFTQPHNLPDFTAELLYGEV